MTHRATIVTFLTSAAGPICDDCLSARTRIRPRQTVHLNCSRMAKTNEISRSTATVCHYCRSQKICSLPSTGLAILASRPASVQVATVAGPHGLWHWEGNIQAALVTWLTTQGWTILRTADTAAKAAGKDIVTEREGRELWISVKGYPRGTQKTNPSTQARHWFAHAVFDLALYRNESESTDLALGLPDGFTTYQKLADRVTWLRCHLPFTIYWVSESGHVRAQEP
jgi:hypothetical protein